MIVVVISCKKHQYLWPTIFNRNVTDLYIVCGGFEETRLNGNIIELKCDDAYEGLPEKVVLAYEFIYKNIPFTHILKADDHDTEFTAEQIKNIEVKFKNILDTKDYIGQKLWNGEGNRKYHFNKTSNTSQWKTQEYSGEFRPWLGGGETYILSKKAINCILLKYNESTLDILRKNEIYEDIMISRILFTNGIYPDQVNYGIKYWKG
jgi:hypothetical protein